jgi:hypothetical protein
MSTERARKKTVEELNLWKLKKDEAVRLLKLANGGVYDTDDMPERWHSVFGGDRTVNLTDFRSARD